VSQQEALKMQRNRATRHKSHLKRPAKGNDLQGHSRSLQLLLLDRPHTSTFIAPLPRYYYFSSVRKYLWPWESFTYDNDV